MAQFATANELGTYLYGLAPDATLDDAFERQAELMLELISGEIQAEAAAPIEAGTGTVYLSGTWGDALVLPARPVTDVDSVHVNGTLVGSDGYAWNGDQVIRSGTVDDLTGSGSLHWNGPDAVVRVVYTWGPGTLPRFVVAMTLRAAGRIAGNPSGIRQETLGPASFTYTVPSDGGYLLESEKRLLRRAFSRTAGSFATR